MSQSLLSPAPVETAEVTEPTELTEATVEPVVTEDELLADQLVEEVSIDGMCGVY